MFHQYFLINFLLQNNNEMSNLGNMLFLSLILCCVIFAFVGWVVFSICPDHKRGVEDRLWILSIGVPCTTGSKGRILQHHPMVFLEAPLPRMFQTPLFWSLMDKYVEPGNFTGVCESLCFLIIFNHPQKFSCNSSVLLDYTS